MELVRPSVARTNEGETVLLAASMVFGQDWVGKGFRVTEGTKENNAVFSGGDWGAGSGSGSGIDVYREVHSNDRRVKILNEPTKTGGGGARSVALTRRKRKIGKGSILTIR